MFTTQYLKYATHVQSLHFEHLIEALHKPPLSRISKVKHVQSVLSLHTLTAALRLLLKGFSVESRLPFLPPNPPYLLVTLFKGHSDSGIKKISHFIQR